ncbi:unnamed protein product, partial [Cladocopium goreaui]
AYSLTDHMDDEVATIQLQFTTLRKMMGDIQTKAFAKQECASAAQVPEQRVTLNLEAVLPPATLDTTWDDSKPQLLWFANEAWLFKLSRAPPCQLHPLPEGLRLPDVCYWPLIHPTPPDNPAHQLTLYLDGAANGTHAAWSVIATLNLPIGEVYIGCMYGCVHLEPDNPQWIGADAMDNIAAELSAMAMAQTCALRWPYSDHLICIRPDLSLSRTVATAVTTCRSNACLAQICRIQGLWLTARTEILEIRGHQGHAWNELADAVAKWALIQGSHEAEPSLGALHEFALQTHDVAWAWMQTTHPALSACFPSLIDQQVMQFDSSDLRVQQAPVRPEHSGSLNPSHAQWTMTVITANVLGNPITLGDAKVSIRHADPRRLVAVASIGQVHYTFVVLHAPCQATQSADTQPNGDVVAEWWSTTSAIWNNTVTTDICWLLVDANAPIDGEHGYHTGPLGAENPSKAGTAFMQFLAGNDLAVPSTFPHIHAGQTTTWSHATGKRSRKDYVAIKAKMMPLATHSWVDIHHDNTFAHADHLPVVLTCKGWQQLHSCAPSFRWDAEKLLDPQCCQDFQHALSTLPIPHWQVDVDDHAAIQEMQILHLGQQFFAKPPRQTHKIKLQPDTLAIIALKRQALDYGRAHKELDHPPFKEELRQLEKLVHCKVRRDTQAFYDALLDRLDHAGELHNHRLVYQLLTRLGRKKGGKAPGPKPLPMLKKEDGTFAATYDEQQRMWMTQFAAVEAGVPCSWAQLQQKHREEAEGLRVTLPEIDPAAFPTVWQIQGGEAPVQDYTETSPMPAEGFIDVTFVDDCAMLVHAPTNQRIEEVIKALVTCFDQAAQSRGLQVNFDRGKTELLWNILGKGAKATKHALYSQGNTLTWEQQGHMYRLHVCHAYKHLGTWTQTKHRHAREILARASAARQQWGQLARPFFRRSLSLATRVRVFQAIVVSKMLYNVHTWAGIKPEELTHWNNHLRGPIALLMKGVLAPQRKFRHPTDTLSAWCGILPLPQQVHLNRLRFAKRLFQRCPAITWRLLNAHQGPTSWIAAFKDSCSWMQQHYDKPHLLPNNHCLQSWIQHMCLDDHWKGRVRKTGKLALHYNTAQAEHAIWQHNFEATLQQAGATLPEDPVPFATPDRWQCDLCSKVFTSTRALAMHASRDHGYRKKVRYFAAGATCHVCNTLFHTRSRLAVHFEHNTRCYDVIQACWPPMPETEVNQLDQEDRLTEAALRKQGWWATKAFLPAVKTCGPSLPPGNDQASARMFQNMLARRPTDAAAYHQLQGRRVSAAPANAPDLPQEFEVYTVQQFMELNEIHGAWFDPSNPVVPMSGTLRGDLMSWLLEWETKCDLCLALGTSMVGMNSDRMAISAAQRAKAGKALGTVIVALQQTQYDTASSLRIFAPIDAVMQLLSVELQLGPEMEMPRPQVTELPHVYGNLPYDKNGQRSDRSRITLDLREGARLRLVNQQGWDQERWGNEGVVLSPQESLKDEGHYAIAVGGGPVRVLGLWWLEAAQRGAVQALPVVNCD